MFWLSINSPLDSPPQQSRLECSEFRYDGAWGHDGSRSKLGVILRQPCGGSSSAARRDVPADALRRPQARDRSVDWPNLGGCARDGNAP